MVLTLKTQKQEHAWALLVNQSRQLVTPGSIKKNKVKVSEEETLPSDTHTHAQLHMCTHMYHIQTQIHTHTQMTRYKNFKTSLTCEYISSTRQMSHQIL